MPETLKGFLINSSKEMFSLDTICLGNHNLTPYWTSGVRLLSRVTVRMRLLWVFRKMVYLRRPSVKEVLQRADLFREKIRKKDVLHLVLFTWAKSNVDLARPKCRVLRYFEHCNSNTDKYTYMHNKLRRTKILTHIYMEMLL